MLASYSSKFFKVFLSSILLISLILVFLVSLYKYTAPEYPEFPPDYIFFIVKYILPPFVFIAQGLYIWSHYLLAKAKGYSGWFALLGFINTFGLLILFLLPDKRTTGDSSEKNN